MSLTYLYVSTGGFTLFALFKLACLIGRAMAFGLGSDEPESIEAPGGASTVETATAD